jgi:sodium transport system permease protein
VRLICVVWCKEVLENLRDRRTILSSLVFGPLFAPIMFAVMMHIVVDQAVSSAQQELRVPTIGAERAPNLLAFLAARGIVATDDHGMRELEQAASAVRSGLYDLVVVVDPDFGEAFGARSGARVTVVFDRSSSRDSGRAQRIENVLRGYSEQIGALRLLARGVSPDVVRPILVDEYDVSTPAGRSALVLGVLTYFLLFATLVGGLYLAIDTTAGERERRSLEPLLTTPISRTQLLTGKIAATATFMLFSLALTLAGFTIALRFVPLDQLGMSSGFNAVTALAAFGILAPIAPLGATLLTLVASFTKSYKEAQTYLGLLLLVPTLPVIVATLLNVEASPRLMWIPSLSQHLLVTALIKAEPIEPALLAESVLSTLVFGLLLGALAARLYRREGLLG